MAEQQLNLIKKGVGRGGSRSGAGRKRSTEGSKVVRVPEPYMKAVKALIDLLDKAETLQHDQVIEPETIYVYPKTVGLKGISYDLNLKVKLFDNGYINQKKPTKAPE